MKRVICTIGPVGNIKVTKTKIKRGDSVHIYNKIIYKHIVINASLKTHYSIEIIFEKMST